MKTSKASSSPFNPLIKVDFTATESGAIISAGGEKATFTGRVFSTVSDGTLKLAQKIEKREFIVFSATLNAAKPSLVKEVAWFEGKWDPACELVLNSTNYNDAFLFVRKGSVSFFLSLDFPYSKIKDGAITYPPYATIVPGKALACHSLTIGACMLTGESVGQFDRAEIEAASAYVERRYPQRFNRPMFTSTCITNRMTECRGNRIFYNMEDNPTIGLSPDVLEEDIRLMAELGVEYFQLFEGVFDWPDKVKSSRNMKKLMQLGRKLGVKLGDYVHPGGPYIPHYNYDGRALNRPDLLQRKADGTPNGHCCLGSSEFVDIVKPRLIAHNRKYREEFICMDMLSIEPCYAENHGHPKGDTYSQIKGLVDLMDSLAALSPNYLVWTNSGNWIEYMPKLIWHNPNVYLTDPHVRGYESTLNQLKLLGDNRREQMVTVHEKNFVPYRAFCNCEYYAFPRSRVHDLRVFEYSFLQGLAVTPNICPCETRTFFNRISGKNRDACAAFMKQWMRFIKKNFNAWKNTLRVGDFPGVGASEIYSHMTDSGDRGFVCLVNQNSFPRQASFRLDSSIGLAHGERLLVEDVYPGTCPIAEQALPFSSYGDRLSFELPPHSVRFLSIKPHAKSKALRVFGHQATVSKTAAGYRLRLKAPQGEVVKLGLELPEGQELKAVASRQTPSVPIFTFPVPSKIVSRKGNLARLEVTLPRGEAPRALTSWKVQPGNVEVTLPELGKCGFLGALIHGTYRETIEAEIELTVSRSRSGKSKATLPPLKLEQSGHAQSFPSAKEQTFCTEFELPFIEGFGMEPGYDDDTVMELAFADASAVESVSATINGKSIEVRKYVYPRDKTLFSYYMELTGQTSPGKIALEIAVRWKQGPDTSESKS